MITSTVGGWLPETWDGAESVPFRLSDWLRVMLAIIGYQPTWRGCGVAYLLTRAWAAVASAVNALTGANDGYLGHPPAGASLLDVLGPWP